MITTIIICGLHVLELLRRTSNFRTDAREWQSAMKHLPYVVRRTRSGNGGRVQHINFLK